MSGCTTREQSHREPSQAGGRIRRLAAMLMGTLLVTSLTVGPAGASTGRAFASTAKPPSPPLLLPGPARTVALSFWSRWQSALASGDAAQIRRLSTPGPVQDAWVDVCTDKSYAFFTPCKVEPFLGLSVIVPIEPKYPLYLLAQFKTREQIERGNALQTTYFGGALELDVLTKASPSAPWRLSFDSGDGSSTLTPPAYFPFVPMSGVGYDDGLDAPDEVVFDHPITKVPNLLDAYYQTWADTGAPPPNSPIYNGPFSSGLGAQIAAGGRQGSVSEGYRVYTYWAADPAVTGLWKFYVTQANAKHFPDFNPFLMECFSLEVTYVYKPGPGEDEIVQRSSRIDFGPDLAPGIYSKVTQIQLDNACVETDGSKYVVAHYDEDGFYSSTGTREK
jgi:hypothetical protein